MIARIFVNTTEVRLFTPACFGGLAEVCAGMRTIIKNFSLTNAPNCDTIVLYIEHTMSTHSSCVHLIRASRHYYWRVFVFICRFLIAKLSSFITSIEL